MSNKKDTKEVKSLNSLHANSINDLPYAVAWQWMEKAKRLGKSPKVALEELCIHVPSLVSDSWELVDFKSLVEIKVVSIKDHNDTERPIYSVITGVK